jgi:hypothetical protein
MSNLKELLERAFAFDTTKAHKEICKLALDVNKWSMSIPPQTYDSDMVLQEPLDHINKITPLAKEIILELCEALEFLSTSKHGEYYMNNHAQEALAKVEARLKGEHLGLKTLA